MSAYDTIDSLHSMPQELPCQVPQRHRPSLSFGKQSAGTAAPCCNQKLASGHMHPYETAEAANNSTPLGQPEQSLPGFAGWATLGCFEIG